MFIRFDRTHERVRQTDRRTDGQTDTACRHIPRLCIASRCKKSSDFDEILYTAADFELDERHVIKNEKVALGRLRVRVRQNVFLVASEF